MKIVYLYNRPLTEADEFGADEVYIDYPNTRRIERIAMIESKGLRSGDTLYLRAAGDLGRGAEASALRQRIEAMGVTVEVVAGEPVKSPGRAPKLTTTDEQKDRLCRLWRSPAEQKHVLARAEKIMGAPVNRNQMNRLCGNRHKE